MQGRLSPSSYGAPAAVPPYVAIAEAAKATDAALAQREAQQKREIMLATNPHLDPTTREVGID